MLHPQNGDRFVTIAFDPLIYENVCMITSLPTKRIVHGYHSEKHLPEIYPQDGGESQLALKLRHSHLMYRQSRRRRG